MDIVGIILNMLLGTPAWVWLLFALLVYRGIKALSPSITSLRMLSIFPIVLLLLSIQSLIGQTHTFQSRGIWLGSFIIGMIIGWQLFKHLTIKADKKQNLIQLPGSPVTLILVITIFITKYYFGYNAVVNPILAQSFWFMSIKQALFAGISGIALGRTFSYFAKFQLASHTDLKKS